MVQRLSQITTSPTSHCHRTTKSGPGHAKIESKARHPIGWSNHPKSTFHSAVLILHVTSAPNLQIYGLWRVTYALPQHRSVPSACSMWKQGSQFFDRRIFIGLVGEKLLRMAGHVFASSPSCSTARKPKRMNSDCSPQTIVHEKHGVGLFWMILAQRWFWVLMWPSKILVGCLSWVIISVVFCSALSQASGPSARSRRSLGVEEFMGCTQKTLLLAPGTRPWTSTFYSWVHSISAFLIASRKSTKWLIKMIICCISKHLQTLIHQELISNFILANAMNLRRRLAI